MFRVLFGVQLMRAGAMGLAFLSMTGCAWLSGQYESAPVTRPQATTMAAQTNVIMTAARSPSARVVSVNTQARFAVLSFPVGQLPAPDTRLAIFRGGAKVGELKISGPAEDTFTVGDITVGSAQEGDEVRAE
jgi:hypothetical protein